MGTEEAPKRNHHNKDASKDRDILAKEQPIVLESSESDPTFPAMQEFEVDAGGPAGSTRKHPGLLWFALAAAAIVVLVIGLIAFGDWN